MPYTRPSQDAYLRWAENSSGTEGTWDLLSESQFGLPNVIDPSSGIRDQGFTAGGTLSAQFLNALFNRGYRYLKWLAEVFPSEEAPGGAVNFGRVLILPNLLRTSTVRVGSGGFAQSPEAQSLFFCANVSALTFVRGATEAADTLTITPIDNTKGAVIRQLDGAAVFRSNAAAAGDTETAAAERVWVADAGETAARQALFRPMYFRDATITHNTGAWAAMGYFVAGNPPSLPAGQLAREQGYNLSSVSRSAAGTYRVSFLRPVVGGQNTPVHVQSSNAGASGWRTAWSLAVDGTYLDVLLYDAAGVLTDGGNITLSVPAIR